MELTQRLACTQSLDETPTQSICPEQVGFLGICGQKYPVVRGPNKIGRDPDTCNIVLKLNSISRHHAVINVLNNSEFMLMDLNSANKTKLDNKMLEPYIPYPLKNGNMVQLGQVFGIFSVLQDDNDLPMTQALDIPDTPIVSRHVSKFNNVHVTTVPESPDVSDKDDSFIMPSQPKPKEPKYKFPGKTSEEPTARKKIDNNFWNSSRKSESIHLQSNTTIGSPNNLFMPVKSAENKITLNNIHELNTQIPNDNNESTDSLFTAETQMPENRQSLNIYNMETQAPVSEKLPAVCKVNNQENFAIDFFTDNKENDIFEAETQAVNASKPSTPIIKHNVEPKSDKLSLTTSQTSDDIIIFDEMESEPPIEVFESQALLPEDEAETQNPIPLNKNECTTDKASKRKERLKSDSSTDCEDDVISLSQNMRDHLNDDDDETDCEDVPPNQEGKKKPDNDDDLTDCEDDLFAPHVNHKADALENDVALEDLPTQVIADDKIKTNENDIDDMLTQVIQVNENESNLESGDNIDDMLTQVVIPEDKKKSEFPLTFQTKPSNSPFKVPLSPMKTRKDIKNLSKKSIPELNDKDKDDLDFHYASTQEVFDDLCSQREIQIVVSSPQRTVNRTGTNDISEGTVKTNVTCSNKKDFIDVAKPKKVGSGDSSSDVESTPKKVPLTFMETDLPDSQEIKSSMTRSNRNNAIELSSESETENDSEQCTPILFRHSKKKTNDAKMNLSKKFEIDALPTRIITRVRKPTAKALNNADTSSNITKNILKPKFLPEQEENIDKEIITENLTRLKSKATKHSPSEKTTKKDSTKTDRKTEKEETEKSKKKSKEKNTDKKQTKSNSQNTIEGYLNNTNVDKSKSSSRTTRSRAKNKASDKKSTSPDVKSRNSKVEEKKTKSSKVEEKKKEKKSTDIEKTVRRSRRRKAQDDEQKISKEIDKSNVYSVNSTRNSESSLDSSNALKRPAEFQFPSAKKAKTSNGGGYTIDTQYVLFTAFPNEEVKIKLESLGAVIVCDVMHCTVVLTLQIKRTFKLLCAVGLGRPVVGPNWVQACADANCILDPNQYILRDEATEQRFQFDLQKTIRSRRNFLKGYKVSSTPKVLPNAKEMKMIVECSGGTWKEGGKNWLCVSCAADKPLWPQYKRKGAIVVSTELILAGVLRQRLDIEENRLA